ncbi:glycoside hydrolase [Gillisia sp. M10.2A]|uniref:Glycoside hydrolase n=1 Tax=Gillisia lutea TaxID=2909668 RepID=A0ABS9ED82_9FLAO|nr:glycoside hydrolase [Gillisia lutea]MCF4100835.1 glycoside hydrolase [Gillisia lutea]
MYSSRTYNKGKLMNFKVLRSLEIPVFCILLLAVIHSCQSPQQLEEKINGISLVASRDSILPGQVLPIKEIHANAVALMPFGFLEKLDSPHLKFNMERQWFGEREEGVRKSIRMLRTNKMKVMLKPQIWIWRGEFTGDIKMNSEADWKEFEKNYRNFILLYAQVAAEEKVDIFTLGTELYGFVHERQNFWSVLIADVRRIYKGQLTYAENWDKVEKVTFWRELDYVGVDAYFPLNSERSPEVEKLRSAWQSYKVKLEDLSHEVEQPILFTEYGYRNTDYATEYPWESSRETNSFNDDLQANALTALYEEFWKENWFAGGFLWKWHQDHENAGGLGNNQFTPQNKPAQEVVKKYYGNTLIN